MDNWLAFNWCQSLWAVEAGRGEATSERGHQRGNSVLAWGAAPVPRAERDAVRGKNRWNPPPPQKKSPIAHRHRPEVHRQAEVAYLA